VWGFCWFLLLVGGGGGGGGGGVFLFFVFSLVLVLGGGGGGGAGGGGGNPHPPHKNTPQPHKTNTPPPNQKKPLCVFVVWFFLNCTHLLSPLRLYLSPHFPPFFLFPSRGHFERIFPFRDSGRGRGAGKTSRRPPRFPFSTPKAQHLPFFLPLQKDAFT